MRSRWCADALLRRPCPRISPRIAAPLVLCVRAVSPCLLCVLCVPVLGCDDAATPAQSDGAPPVARRGTTARAGCLTPSPPPPVAVSRACISVVCRSVCVCVESECACARFPRLPGPLVPGYCEEKMLLWGWAILCCYWLAGSACDIRGISGCVHPSYCLSAGTAGLDGKRTTEEQ